MRAAIGQPLLCGGELCLQSLPARLRRDARSLLLAEARLDADQACATPAACGLCCSVATSRLTTLSVEDLKVRCSLLSERLGGGARLRGCCERAPQFGDIGSEPRRLLGNLAPRIAQDLNLEDLASQILPHPTQRRLLARSLSAKL